MGIIQQNSNFILRFSRLANSISKGTRKYTLHTASRTQFGVTLQANPGACGERKMLWTELGLHVHVCVLRHGSNQEMQAVFHTCAGHLPGLTTSAYMYMCSVLLWVCPGHDAMRVPVPLLPLPGFWLAVSFPAPARFHSAWRT